MAQKRYKGIGFEVLWRKRDTKELGLKGISEGWFHPTMMLFSSRHDKGKDNHTYHRVSLSSINKSPSFRIK